MKRVRLIQLEMPANNVIFKHCNYLHTHKSIQAPAPPKKKTKQSKTKRNIKEVYAYPKTY